jgi:hypothetical protein
MFSLMFLVTLSVILEFTFDLIFSTVNKYKEKAKCMIDQYSNYFIKQINKSVTFP